MPSVLTSFAILAGILALTVTLLPASFQIAPPKPSVQSEMSAISYSSHGSTDVLEFGTLPQPSIKANQILVHTEYAALNPCDFKFRRMEIPSFIADFLFPKPKIPALDLAGVVAEVGADVTAFKVGDRVAATQPIVHTRWGTLSEYSAVDASHAALVPETVSLRDAAAVSLVGLTAVQALANVATSPGDTILIHAGSGGLGSFAVQWASKVLGLHVSATASAKNKDFLESLGADVAYDYRAEGSDAWDAGEPNFDVILDPMSYAYESRVLGTGVLSPTGHYLNIASSNWAPGKGGIEEANGLQTYLNLAYYGIKNAAASVGLGEKGMGYSFVAIVPDGEMLAGILAQLEKGAVRAVIDKQFDLAEAKQAYEHLETGRAKGKVVIKI